MKLNISAKLAFFASLPLLLAVFCFLPTILQAATPKTINITVQDDQGNLIDAQVNCYSTTSSLWSASGNTTNGQVALSTVGGSHACLADANLSETDPTIYPWIYTGKAKNVTFSEDETAESIDLTFTVTQASSLVTGRFLDQYGEPLLGGSFQADITFKREDGVLTRRKVDASGIFHVYLTPGVWTIWPLPHSSQQYESQSWPDTIITVGEDETIALGDIQAIVRGSRITGTLTDQDGNPLSGANLILTRENTPQREFRDTFDNGTYNIAVGPGTYTIGKGDIGFIGGYQFDRVATVYIPDNETEVSDVDFVAHLYDMNINGNIKNGATPLEDFHGSVVAESSDGSYSASGTIDEDGEYQIKIATSLLGDSAQVLLDVKTQEGEDFFSPEQTAVNVTHVTVNQDIAMTPDNATISGNITDLGGEIITDPGTDVKVVAISENGSIEKAEVNDQGEYDLTVPEGQYILGLEINDASAANIITTNGNYLTTEVAAGQTADIDFPIQEKEATVTGTVLDDQGQPVAQAPVTITNALHETDPDKIVYLDTETDSAGVYSADLPAGDFTILVNSNPETVDLIEPKKEEFSVEAGATAEVNDMAYQEADAVLTGTISADQNIISAKVAAISDDGGFVETDVVNGAYSLPVKKGNWKMVASGLVDGILYVSELTDETVADTADTADLTITTTGQTVPGVVSTTGEADETITLSNSAGASVSLDPYATGFSGSVDVDLIPVAEILPTADGGIQTNIAYEVSIQTNDIPVNQLQIPATVTVPLEEEGLITNQEIDETKLSAQYWSPNEESWQANGVIGLIDTANNQVSFQVDHLTKFALIYTPESVDLSVDLSAPTNLRVTARGPKKATLRWDSDAPKFRVQVSKRAKNKKTTYKGITKNLKKLTKQTSNQAWKWRVKACDLDGNCGNYSSYDYYRTDPAKPTNLKYNQETEQLSWKTVRGELRYKIKVMNAKGKKLNLYTVKQASQKKSRKSYNLSLTEGKKYKVKIKARYGLKKNQGANNLSAWSKVKTIDLR